LPFTVGSESILPFHITGGESAVIDQMTEESSAVAVDSEGQEMLPPGLDAMTEETCHSLRRRTTLRGPDREFSQG